MKASGEASHLGSTIFPSLPTESCFLRKRLFKLARWMLPSSGQMCPYSVSQFEGRRCKTQAPILLTLVCMVSLLVISGAVVGSLRYELHSRG